MGICASAPDKDLDSETDLGDAGATVADAEVVVPLHWPLTRLLTSHGMP